MTKDVKDIPKEFVPLSYIMDPETEILVSGDDLQDGMVVLVESAVMRENPFWRVDEDADPYHIGRLRRTSRWCRVSKLRRISMTRDESHVISFIGIYADGSQAGRDYSNRYYWYVKKDSIKDVE